MGTAEGHLWGQLWASVGAAVGTAAGTAAEPCCLSGPLCHRDTSSDRYCEWPITSLGQPGLS